MIPGDIHRLKSSGPRKEPCGTAYGMSVLCDEKFAFHVNMCMMATSHILHYSHTLDVHILKNIELSTEIIRAAYQDEPSTIAIDFEEKLMELVAAAVFFCCDLNITI